jgi:hypothetical protein
MMAGTVPAGSLGRSDNTVSHPPAAAISTAATATGTIHRLDFGSTGTNTVGFS